MKWQTVLLVLLVTALAALDLSALAAMTSEPAADIILALAASQVALAGLWCGTGGGSCFVRLAVAGLVVNTWSSALGPFGHEMAVVLLSELAIVLAGVLCRRLLLSGSNVLSATPGPSARLAARFSLADMLALTTIFALLLGPLRTLVPAATADGLKLLGAALGCQALAVAWAAFSSAATAPRWSAAVAASILPIVAAEPLLMSPMREVRVAVLSAALLAAGLAVVRISYRRTAPLAMPA